MRPVCRWHQGFNPAPLFSQFLGSCLFGRLRLRISGWTGSVVGLLGPGCVGGSICLPPSLAVRSLSALLDGALSLLELAPVFAPSLPAPTLAES